jgi:hypothetical protein
MSVRSGDAGLNYQGYEKQLVPSYMRNQASDHMRMKILDPIIWSFDDLNT